MSKATDVDDLLGTDTKPAKGKPAAKKVAAPAPVAVKPAAKKVAAPAPVEAPAKAARTKEPIVFEEGEQAALAKRIKQIVKKPWNSKSLAEKLEIPTRKLRRVLYGMSTAGTISLELGASRAQGMTVSPA